MCSTVSRNKMIHSFMQIQSGFNERSKNVNNLKNILLWFTYEGDGKLWIKFDYAKKFEWFFLKLFNRSAVSVSSVFARAIGIREKDVNFKEHASVSKWIMRTSHDFASLSHCLRFFPVNIYIPVVYYYFYCFYFIGEWNKDGEVEWRGARESIRERVREKRKK